MNLSNCPKPSIQTVNIIRITTIIKVIIIFMDGIAIAEARKVNVMYARRRTAIYRNIYQRNRSTLKRYIKRNIIQIKVIMAISRTNISNILPSIKEIMRINVIKPLKPLSQTLLLIITLKTKILIIFLLLLEHFLPIKQLL